MQRLAKLMLAALTMVVLMLLYLITHTVNPTIAANSAAASTVLTTDPSSLAAAAELPQLPASPHPASRWSDLTPPLSRESLGQATWSFLHTVAAVYPEQPNELEQRSARQLLEALGWLYPCAVCAEHFRTTLSARPPRVGSRRELSEWLCEAHNEVNGRLDKQKSVTASHVLHTLDSIAAATSPQLSCNTLPRLADCG